MAKTKIQKAEDAYKIARLQILQITGFNRDRGILDASIEEDLLGIRHQLIGL